MPSPIGHALAGLATAWISTGAAARRTDPLPPTTRLQLTIACVAAAVAPDIDLLFHAHRSYSHSVGAAAIAGVIAWLAAHARGPGGAGRHAVTIGITVGFAYATHILLDWLGRDTATPLGVMALWPFSSRFYLSGADLFTGISRRYWRPNEFIYGNLRSVARELVVLAPAVAAAAWFRFVPRPSRRHSRRQDTALRRRA